MNLILSLEVILKRFLFLWVINAKSTCIYRKLQGCKLKEMIMYNNNNIQGES